MKLALITDTHWGARGDNDELRNSMVEFYRDQFFPTIEEENCDGIIHLGDLVDRRKYINIKTLKTMREEFLDRIKIPMDIICGNHDTYYKNTNQLNALTELIDDRRYINVYIGAINKQWQNNWFLYVPWITETNYDDTMDMIARTDSPIVMGHLELSGFQMIKGQMCHHGLNHKVFEKFSRVFTGHFHLKSSFDNIHYLGSPYHMNWGEADNRCGFHIFDTDTLELKFHQNTRSMFNKIFFDKNTDTSQVPNIANTWVRLIVKEKPDPFAFDLWHDKLVAQQPLELRVVEPITQVGEEVIVSGADNTETIIDRSIDARLELEDGVKVNLKNLMHELYKEASNFVIEK